MASSNYFFALAVLLSLVSSFSDSSQQPLHSSQDSKSLHLTVVHRDSQYSPLTGEKKLSVEQILELDTARFNAFGSFISSASKNGTVEGALAVSIPAYSGSLLDTGNYVITVGIGTPKKDLTVMFDTGSDLSWILCSTCKECEGPKKLLFDRTESATYSSIQCNSDDCSQAGDSSSCSAESNDCRFAISYDDGTIAKGSIIRDTLTLAPFDVLPNFMFGCSDYYTKKHLTVGLIGLSRDKVSFFSQVSQKYGEVFSYCIPSSVSSTGYLAFGRAALPPHIKYTPMLTMPPVVGSLYFVRLAGIKVAGKTLPLPSTVFSRATTAIDSGGVITRLPPLAYSALRSEFRKHMTEYTLIIPHKFVLDTCYDMSRHKDLNVPTVELLFDGGASLSLDFDGTMVMGDDQRGCLAFTATDDMHGGVSILGNIQQKKYTVVYDVTNGKVGFGSGGCA